VLNENLSTSFKHHQLHELVSASNVTKHIPSRQQPAQLLCISSDSPKDQDGISVKIKRHKFIHQKRKSLLGCTLTEKYRWLSMQVQDIYNGSIVLNESTTLSHTK
jgi:hypothetical protein